MEEEVGEEEDSIEFIQARDRKKKIYEVYDIVNENVQPPLVVYRPCACDFSSSWLQLHGSVSFIFSPFIVYSVRR